MKSILGIFIIAVTISVAVSASAQETQPMVGQAAPEFTLNDLTGKSYSLKNSKGKIEKGFDADLVVWDPESSFIVNEIMIRHRHKVTPYLGEQLFGAVKQTWLAGQKVYDNGNFILLNKGSILLG